MPDAIMEKAKTDRQRALDDMKRINDEAKESGIVEFDAETQERYDAAKSRYGRWDGVLKREAEIALATQPYTGDVQKKGNGDGGFEHPRDFLVAVRNAGIGNTPLDRRLDEMKYAATGMGIVTPSEGGFLCPDDMAKDVIARTLANIPLLELLDRRDIHGTSLRIPTIQESSRATTRYGGLDAKWSVSEGGSLTATKPAYGIRELHPDKLVCYIVASDELVEDMVGLEQHLQKAVPAELAFQLIDKIINGVGAGEPIGVVGHSGTVSVAKEAAQDATTVNFQNIVKMASRLKIENPKSVAWLCNQDVLPQICGIALSGGTAMAPMFIGPGQMPQSPATSLLGWPVHYTECCQTLGQVGDIILGDWSAYILASKVGHPLFASSLHVYFSTDQAAYRWVWRVRGIPAFDLTLTPAHGSNALASFVTLDKRE